MRGNARTEDRGVYRITGLAPGRYYVRTVGAGIRVRHHLPARGG